jgi:hypothetical protein
MLTKMFKLLLHLYPDGHRSTFGQEMLSLSSRGELRPIIRARSIVPPLPYGSYPH